MQSIACRKLAKELAAEIITESGLAYVLVLVRKCLEEDGLKEKYPCLNLYCNWALHYQINKTAPIKEMIGKMLSTGEMEDWISFRHFFEELDGFLSEKGVSVNIQSLPKYKRRIQNLLVDIFIEVPLFVVLNDKTFEVKLVNPGVGTENHISSMCFTITPLS